MTHKDYEAVIGLEVHLQLDTQTKLFCSCRASFGAVPNSQTCPVCLGYPGALPVFNAQAFERGIRVALSLQCRIAEVMKFDRKQYFYPDLPKGYQISQYDRPIGLGGNVEIRTESKNKRIGITRVHLEEDAGKLLHDRSQVSSAVDYNRAGVPLLEIVSEPDMRSGEEAYQYLVELKGLIQYLDVSTCNMEEGSLRCDTNVSLRRKGETDLGVKVEIKNLNSFRAVRLAADYEIQRQAAILDQLGTIAQETRLWDEKRAVTESMRSKEEASDYRYFPEPDLVPFIIEASVVEKARNQLPELPAQRRERFQKAHGLSSYDAQVLTQQRPLAELFEQTLKLYGNPKPVANWIVGDLAGYLKSKEIALEEVTFKPIWLAGLLKLLDNGTLSGKMAKQVFIETLEKGISPEQVVKEKGLKQITDTSALETVAKEVIVGSPRSVEDYRSGQEKALMYLVGQCMKRTQGKANPQQIIQILKKQIDGMQTGEHATKEGAS